MDPKNEERLTYNNMQITINFGLSNSITKEVPDGTTVGQILSDRTFQSALGFGDNVVAKIDGFAQDNNRRLVNGDQLDLEVRANQKAAKKMASPEPPKEQTTEATPTEEPTQNGQAAPETQQPEKTEEAAPVQTEQA